ncbi:MAG: methionine aminotransferase [Gammaproteobacteria bacterium]
MTPEFTSKLPDVGTTIFSVMSALAADNDAINLAQGFPDFEPPQALREAVTRHVNGGRNQYAPMHGIAPLRKAIAARFDRRYGVKVDEHNEVTVTSGASEAIYCAITALCGSGDEVIVFDPAYDCYDPVIRLAGATPVHLALTANTFRIDFEKLRDALSPRTRLVIINSPHNPTATVMPPADLDQLAAAIEPLRCFLLSDEVYDAITFDEHVHTSVVGHSVLRDRSVAVFSFGKTYHATGWKVGYAIAPESITAELRRVHQFNAFATAAPLQYAIADFMQDEPQFETTLREFYVQKRDHFRREMDASRFVLPVSSGTYFQLAEYSAISDEPDTAFARRLTTEFGVAAIPVSVFYEQPPQGRWVRFCFAKNNATLSRAATALSSA